MEKTIINKITDEKNRGMELILVSVIITIGVNMLYSGLISLFNLENKIHIQIIGGIILSIVVIILSIIIRVRTYNSFTKLSGFFILNKKEKNFLSVSDYPISEQMAEHIEAAISEDKSIRKKWIKAVDKVSKHDPQNEISSEDDFQNFINELLEYSIIQNISSELENYFSSIAYNDKKVTVYTSNNIPACLSTNRFINLFSKNIKKRPAFNNKVDTYSEISRINNDGQETLFNAKIENGALYNYFELIVPKGTKLTKKYKNQLLINTKNFKIQITWFFNYYGNCIDNEFYNYYLNSEKNWDWHNEFSFEIEVKINFKTSVAFKSVKLENYAWCDELVNSLAELVDKKVFLDKINWKQNKLLINYINKSSKFNRLY
jgi:hypothetical protein